MAIPIHPHSKHAITRDLDIELVGPLRYGLSGHDMLDPSILLVSWYAILVRVWATCDG